MRDVDETIDFRHFKITALFVCLGRKDVLN